MEVEEIAGEGGGGRRSLGERGREVKIDREVLVRSLMAGVEMGAQGCRWCWVVSRRATEC